MAQCIAGDCNNGFGKLRFRNGSVYSGRFQSNLFHGKGEIAFASKDFFEGNFIRGRRQGQGRYVFASGHVYVGDFKDDKRTGNGIITYQSGDIYEGEWLNDMPNGKGVYKFRDGASYKGGFVSGDFEGNGTFSENSGETYNGIWRKNKLVRKTISTQSNVQSQIASASKANVNSTEVEPKPRKIKDCTNQYCTNEEGRFNYKDGSYFIGNFINGQPDGDGTTQYINGDLYKGGWKNHGPYGKGTMFQKAGQIHSGVWENGRLTQRNYATQGLATLKQKQDEKINKFNEEVSIYAVVVGVATYNHMSSLKYTDDDAYHLYAFLKSPEGGAIPDENISILIDDAATKKSILNEIAKTFAKADKNDVVLLYMSGHGLEGSFIPSDFDGINNQLMYTDILQLIDNTQAKHKLFIADACHSGSMYASKSISRVPVSDFYTKIKNSKGGTAMLTSSKTDEVSLEYSGMRHGLFSHYLIIGLKGDANKNNDHFVSIEELYDYVYLNVRHHTNNKQTPSIGGDYDKNMPVSIIR